MTTSGSVSPSTQPMPETSPFDVLADELGAVAGRIERESKLRIDVALAEAARCDAERNLRTERALREVQDRLASIKDGEPGVAGASVTLNDVRPMLEEMVNGLPKPADGKSVTLDDVRPMLEEMVAALPKPKDGKEGAPGPAAELSIVPDDIAEQISKAVTLLAESPQLIAKSPPFVLNINSQERAAKPLSKTITTRKDKDGNLVADVVEH